MALCNPARFFLLYFNFVGYFASSNPSLPACVSVVIRSRITEMAAMHVRGKIADNSILVVEGKQ